MRWPLWMPAGMSTSSSRDSSVRPAPAHALHGCSTMTPRPRHRGQGSMRTKSPKTLRDTCWSRPAPSHWLHVVGVVPGSTPSPLQTAHGTAAS